MTAEPDDEQLLARLSTDPAAFEEFYRRHVGRVQAVLARRLHQPEQVADAVATTFLTVIRAADGFDPRRGRAVPWLFGVAANVAAAERRRQAREGGAVRRLGGHRVLHPDDIAVLEEQLDAAREARAVRAAFDDLSDADRQVIELVALDGLTPGDAARALGIDGATARMRLSRARRRLRAAARPLTTTAPQGVPR